jgi:predicted  nucleic acid-binding Zn-ribbon protein
MFRLNADVTAPEPVPSQAAEHLKGEAALHIRATATRSLESNNAFFIAERERLDHWADDMVAASEHELIDTKNQIKSLTRQARLASTVEDQRAIQEKIQHLEREKRKMRQKIFDVEDEIYAKRDVLIDKLERRIAQKSEVEHLFSIRWSVI